MRDRVIVITGSTRGIGRALAIACAARGAKVAVHGRTRVDDAAAAIRDAIAHTSTVSSPSRVASTVTADVSTVEGARAANARVVGIAADVSTLEGAQAVIDGALAAFGRIDVLVNNAGTSTERAALWELGATEIATTIATNVTAPLLCSRALLAWAVPRGEAVRIVNVSSGIVAYPRDNAAAYIASKAALDAFTRALALDAARANVVVTGVALGGHRTDLARRVLPASDLDALPDADAAVTRVLQAIEAPVDAVHGRVLDAGNDTRALDTSANGQFVQRPSRAPALPGLISPISPTENAAGSISPISPHRTPRTSGTLDTTAIDLLAHPLGPSPRVREALAEVARDGALDRYPDREHAALRKMIAADHGVSLDHVAIGGGIGELLDRVLGVVLRPGETIVANAPSWPMFPHACRERGVAWKPVAYRLVRDAHAARADRADRLESAGRHADAAHAVRDAMSRIARPDLDSASCATDAGFGHGARVGHADHDLEAIAAAVDRTVRLVYLTSPGNPTGRALDAAAFQRFLDALPRHVTVVVDEAYGELATREDALQATGLVAWADRLVVLRSFSKLHGLAGLRIGYALAAPPIARMLARAAPPFPLVRGAAEAAIAALSDRDHARRVIDFVVRERAALEAALDARGIARLASDAPFVLAADPDARGPRVFDRYVMLPAWARIATSATTTT